MSLLLLFTLLLNFQISFLFHLSIITVTQVSIFICLRYHTITISHEELIQVIFHFGGQLYLLALTLTCAFKVAPCTTLYTSLQLINFTLPAVPTHLYLSLLTFFLTFTITLIVLALTIVVIVCPYLETSGLLMANLATEQTFHYILHRALAGFVTYLIAFEAKLCITIEWVMGVTTTENTIQSNSFIRTFSSHMSKLLTVPALYGWVRLDEISTNLILHLREHVVFKGKHVCVIFVGCLRDKLVIVIIWLWFIFFGIECLLEVHVTFECATWNDHVWVTLGIDCWYVVAIISVLLIAFSLLFWLLGVDSYELFEVV